MGRKRDKLLHDILTSVQQIEEYLGDRRVFTEFESNRMQRKAIEREFEIIGEAMRRLLELEPEIPITDKRRVIDFRNRLAHAYDAIENAAVWGIIVNHLPVLKTEVQQLLHP